LMAHVQHVRPLLRSTSFGQGTRFMVDGGLSSALRFAAVVDAERMHLLAIGEDRLELWQPHVGAMRGNEARDFVPAASVARLADDGERRRSARVMKSRGILGEFRCAQLLQEGDYFPGALS
jgi:hypothetical protein